MSKLLASVDFSELTPLVIDLAAELAKQRDTELWVLHVAPPEPDFAGRQLMRKVVEGEVPEKLSEPYQKLRDIEGDVLRRGVAVHTLLVQGEPVASILEEARILSAEFIVMGSHGRGTVYRAVVGSVCEGVLREARCPLVIIPKPNAG